MLRSLRRPQALVFLTLLAVVVGLVLWLDIIGRADGSQAARGPVAIRAALTTRMQTTLEHLPPGQHQGHGGHGANGKPIPVVCGTRVYGYEPAEAATVDDVLTVYGFHMCAQAEAGKAWDWSQRVAAPLVLQYDGGPPTVLIAESANGASYQDRVKQLFPVQYQQAAFQQALEPAAMAELRRRYEAVAGPTVAASG